MARCLVTGGAGFIGSHVVEALVGRGDEVVVFDDLSTGRWENLAGVRERVTVEEGDVRDAERVTHVCRGIDVVFHHAAVSLVGPTLHDPLLADAINVGGTLHVLEAARVNNVRRVVLASSAAVYGSPAGVVRSEDMVPQPQSPYAVTKVAAEQYGRVFGILHGVETVALRYFNVYGPRQASGSPYSGVVAALTERLGRGESGVIYGDGRQSRDFVYVADVAMANVAASVARFEEVAVCFNVGSGRALSIQRLYDVLATVLGVVAPPVFAEAREGDVRYSRADVARAREVLGWQSRVSIEEGLRRFVSWQQQERATTAS